MYMCVYIVYMYVYIVCVYAVYMYVYSKYVHKVYMYVYSIHVCIWNVHGMYVSDVNRYKYKE